MKKNISINISGIIFHIEEDGYDTLKKYLDSINRYFSSFEDSTEILADIESRIAEIFLSKLNEGKQVITAEDVNSLVTTMGSVSDFKAAEEEETADDSRQSKSAYQGEYSSRPGAEAKQLFRDTRRKILGGVCSGIAHYLKVDPVWIRLLFAILTFAYGLTFWVYIILWIVLPKSSILEETESSRKMFRDSENKVLGGVATGISSYFGIDILAVRILFIVFSMVGGLGLLVYIVLWIVLPEARSLTDRMKMQGEPLTLSNIESNVKKGLNIKEGEEENALTKTLLFPFRAIALIIRGLAEVIGPVSEVFRVAVGIIILLIGFSLMFSVVVSIGIALGLFTFQWPWMYDSIHANFPFETLHNMIPTWMAIAAFFTVLIPCLLIILLGVSIISKRAVVTAPVGWSMFAVFFISILVVAFSIPQIAYSFKETGEYKEERMYELGSKTAVLKFNEIGLDDYNVTEMTLRGYHGTGLKIVETYEAHGSTRQNAIENAKMIEYNVVQNDSTLIFDSNIRFKEGAVFRAQRLKLTLYIPYNQHFVMEKGISEFITQYIDYNDMDGYTWKITSDGLQCIDCSNNSSSNYYKEYSFEDEDAETIINAELVDFKKIDISGYMDLSIRHGNTYQVRISGPDIEKRKYKTYRSGETLVIDYDDHKSFRFNFDDSDFDVVSIEITMPALSKIDATGVGSIQFEGVSDPNEIAIDAQGPIQIKGEIISENATINLTGTANADIRGRVQSLDASIKFASQLSAYHLEARDASIEVKGASSAEVNVTKRLEMNEGIASDIDFRGNPEIIKKR